LARKKRPTFFVFFSFLLDERQTFLIVQQSAWAVSGLLSHFGGMTRIFLVFRFLFPSFNSWIFFSFHMKRKVE
jgi:hypothetical protein